jgi:hypothetical protein|tara:strand:+ start:79 stop:393 length:315 start_codon:yes stop_codon:yes gene_type:complete
MNEKDFVARLKEIWETDKEIANETFVALFRSQTCLLELTQELIEGMEIILYEMQKITGIDSIIDKDNIKKVKHNFKVFHNPDWENHFILNQKIKKEIGNGIYEK